MESMKQSRVVSLVRGRGMIRVASHIVGWRETGSKQGEREREER